MTKRKAVQVYNNDQERAELESVKQSLGLKTYSQTYKKAISLIFNLKNTII